MSIAIFLGTLGTRAGGMETYETHFLRSLAASDQTTPYHLYCLRPEAERILGINQPNFRFTVLPAGIRTVDIAVTLPMLLRRSDAELLHPTYIPPLFCPVPYVYTVHSAVTWTHPQFYPRAIRWRLNWLQEKGVREARMLLCVSEHVKAFIAERFQVPEERLAVVYHGVSPRFQQRPRSEVAPLLKERYGVDGPYLLNVGKQTANKNIRRMLRAFRQFRRETGSDLRLVLAGRRLWTKGEIDRVIDGAASQGEVIELGHVRHEDMPLLYNGAEGLVFPSLGEGFGLPVLEAFASGIPVLTANNSSLPEIAGDNALLVDATSVEQLADGMHRLTGDTERRRRMIEGGLRRAREFTWDRTVAQTREAYARVLANA